jgi:hypothetical protein
MRLTEHLGRLSREDPARGTAEQLLADSTEVMA